MDQTTIINIYTDGGSRGNPGNAALGVYIEDEERNKLTQIGKKLGVATNNIAEYSAILEALTWVVENKNALSNLKKINMFMDSQLATSQLNGIYKIKNSNIREIMFKIRQRENEIGIPITYSHIGREFNKKADRMVNLALDNQLI